MAEGDPMVKAKIRELRGPECEKGLTYDEQQLTEEVVPLYGHMLVIGNKNMALAEPSTQAHYGVFVEYVEIWNRALKKTLVAEVILEIQHEEKKLYPLYEDLEKQIARLREELKK